MNPSLGRNFEAMDPLEWRARLADHIPDPGKHRTHFYAHHANRVRGERPSEKLGHQKHEEELPKKRRCSPNWARLIAKVFQTDPLVCRRCGGSLKVVAYITDTSRSAGSWTISVSAHPRSHLLNLDRHAGRGIVSPSKAGKDVSMRRPGQIGPAELMPALSHGWWKGWRGPKPLTADFRDRGPGFNVLSVTADAARYAAAAEPVQVDSWSSRVWRSFTGPSLARSSTSPLD